MNEILEFNLAQKIIYPISRCGELIESHHIVEESMTIDLETSESKQTLEYTNISTELEKAIYS